MKKVLILVLSSIDEYPWNSLMIKQKETWDSIEVEGVKTIYYYADSFANRSFINGNDLILNIKETRNLTNRIPKLKKAFQNVMHLEWDFIFRTNSSSYIDKKRLLNFAQTLPIENCYCGFTVSCHNINFASGCGFFISRDHVNKLIKNMDEHSTFPGDDVYTSAMLGQKITPGATLMEIWFEDGETIKDKMSTINFTDTYPYHYRCKSPIKSDEVSGYDRSQDFIAFDEIHKFLYNAN